MDRKKSLYLQTTWMLYLMLLLPLVFFTVFHYLPIPNIVIAFKDYNIFKGAWASSWARTEDGNLNVLKWFIAAFTSKEFYAALKNTVILNLLDLLAGFPAPILLALLLNEIPYFYYKKFTQTVVYLPHFLSWIIISGIAVQLFAPASGIVNIFLGKIGIEPINFLGEKSLWVGTYITLGVWKEMGWGTIIYLAAITAINPELYEAAEVDGAGRARKMWHVTLPGIRPTIVVLLIMNLGRILGSSFDRPYVMSNPMVLDVSDVIATYVYRVGIRANQFSMTTAVGLFQSVVCVLFLITANELAEKFGERGLW